MVTVNVAVHKMEWYQHLDNLNKYLRLMDSNPEFYPDPEVRDAAECFLRNSVCELEELLFGKKEIATGQGDYQEVHFDKALICIVPRNTDKSKGVGDHEDIVAGWN